MSLSTMLLLLVTFLLGVLVMNLIAIWFLRRVLQDVIDAYRADIEQTNRILKFARIFAPTTANTNLGEQG